MRKTDATKFACCVRLEATLDDLRTAASDSNDRHLLDYMFLAGSAQQLQQLAEEGFPQPPPWPLTSSLSLAIKGAVLPRDTVHILVAKVLVTQGCKVTTC